MFSSLCVFVSLFSCFFASLPLVTSLACHNNKQETLTKMSIRCRRAFEAHSMNREFSFFLFIIGLHREKDKMWNIEVKFIITCD